MYRYIIDELWFINWQKKIPPPKAMQADCADEVVLETEVTNAAALTLYERLGFVRDKRLFR